MHSRQFNGIIIRTHASRESDLVLRVLSPELGKVAIYARYARSSKRRFTGGLEVFDRGNFKTIVGKGSLLNLDCFAPLPPFKSLRQDLAKLTVASLIAEAFDLIVQEDQDQSTVSQELFDALLLGLSALDESNDTRDSCRAGYLSLVGLLAATGFLDRGNVGTASLNNFLKLIDHIEHCTERQLMSRSAIEGIFSELRLVTTAA